MFFKEDKNESSNLSKVAALLIHAAKIDENFSKSEETIIKQDLLQIGASVENLEKNDLEFAQKHLRIISGLYGLLRPLDEIEPYRLEMGSNLKGKHGSSLYEYWGNKITENLNLKVFLII